MRLLCIIGRDVFSVNIRGEQSVHELKVVIRDENAQALATIDATKLALYRIDVPLSDDEDKNQEILKEISLGVHKFKFKKMLRAWDEVSQTFDESELPKGTLHVLVELPAGKPINSRAHVRPHTQQLVLSMSATAHWDARAEKRQPTQAPDPSTFCSVTWLVEGMRS